MLLVDQVNYLGQTWLLFKGAEKIGKVSSHYCIEK